MKKAIARYLIVLLVCCAMLLSNFAGLASAAETDTNPVQAQSQPAAEFDTKTLDQLVYTNGTVSAWLEYDCGNGLMFTGANKSYLQIAVNTTYTAFDAYCKALVSAGYTPVANGNNGITGNSSSSVAYGRYKAADGSHTVYVYILNKLNEVRVIVDTQADMVGAYANGFVYNSTTGETAQPMVTMYGLSMSENGYDGNLTTTAYGTGKRNCGALIVIRMPDNSLFINDGGDIEQWSDAACANFMQFCRELTGKSEGEKVVINTWFISHGHSDHFEGFPRFIDQYHDQIDIQSVMYNIDDERLGTSRDMSECMKMVRSFFPAVKYYKPHTGERFEIAGVQFDVLWTQEDRFYPTSNGQQMVIDVLDGEDQYNYAGATDGTYRECLYEDLEEMRSDFNDTSTVLKVYFPDDITGVGDVTSILYGDVNIADQVIIQIWDGTDMLKTDIMMIPHHGHDTHPELVALSDASIFMYTQNKTAIYGPDGDYTTEDMRGTYRQPLTDKFMAMNNAGNGGNLETTSKHKTYWEGNETACMLFGENQTFKNKPNGLMLDPESPDGFTVYTMAAPSFKYEGWTILSLIKGENEGTIGTVTTTNNKYKFQLVTADGSQALASYNERYVFVHDQTDRVMSYDSVGVEAYAYPRVPFSLDVSTYQEAVASGSAEAYYSTSNDPVTGQPEYLYLNHYQRHEALWIITQTKSTTYGNASIVQGDELSYMSSNKAVSGYFGGVRRYHHTELHKGIGPVFNEDGTIKSKKNGVYWYNVVDGDYTSTTDADGNTVKTGSQFRYLQPGNARLFKTSADNNIHIEFFDDGTCLLYYRGSQDVDGDGTKESVYSFFSVNENGIWERFIFSGTSASKAAEAAKAFGLDKLKLRMYQYCTDDGDQTISASGPKQFEIVKGTPLDDPDGDVYSHIAYKLHVQDTSRNGMEIPCSGATPKIGYYWLDTDVNTSVCGNYTATLKFRNDDATDTVIGTVQLTVVDQLVLDAFYHDDDSDNTIAKYGSKFGFFFKGDANGLVYEMDDGANRMDVAVAVNTPNGMTNVYVDVTADMFTDSNGKKLSTKSAGVYNNLTLTYDGTVIGDDFTVQVLDGSVGHRYDDGVVTKEGTCTIDGEKTYTCTICGEQKIEAIKGTGHSYTSEVTKQSGCTTAGERTYTCSACGDSYTESIDPVGHSYNSVTTAPTCTAQGYTTHTCTVCGSSYIDSYVDAKGHSYESKVTVEPGCTSTGVITYTCYCGDVYTERIPAAGHNYVSEVTAPTCTTVGYTTHTCTVCGSSYKDSTVAATGHSYVSEVTKQPGCTTTGTMTYTCSCGSSYTEEIAPLGHSYNAVVTAPTCTEEGYTTHTCTACGDSYVDSYVAATGHAYQSVTTAPTCTEDGYTTHTCANCGDSYVDSKVAALGHSHVANVTTEPGCTTAGVMTYTCSCGDTYTEEIPMLGHDYTSVVTAPTCTEGGYTTHTCTVCGDSYVDSAVAATGHRYKSEVTLAPTTTTAGVMTYTCTVCGHSYTEEIPPVIHTYVGEVTLAPSCETTGVMTYTCTGCGTSYTEEIPALGHKYRSQTFAPTCTSDGYTLHNCVNCGGTKITDIVAMKGHMLLNVVTEPTCTEDGYTTHTCVTCGYIYSDTLVPSSGHTYKGIVTAPTCTEDGYTTYCCTNCDDSYVDDIVASVGHSYQGTVTDPSCAEDGYTTHTCGNCGDSYVDTIVPCVGHSYHGVVIAPTCTEDGYTIYTCANCGDSYVDNIVASHGHSYRGVVTAPTCTESGYTTRTCANCNDSYVDNIVAPTGHSYRGVVTAPTGTEDGYTTHTCANCGDSYEDTIVPANGHIYKGVVTAPTCNEDGYTTYTCANCGHSYKDDVVPAKGQIYRGVVTDPTCTEDGCTTHTCFNCGDVYVDSIVPATGHNYRGVVTAPSGTEDGYTTYTCANCADSYVVMMNSVAAASADDCTVACYCEDTEAFAATFELVGASVVMGEKLDMNFFINQADLSGVDYYAEITVYAKTGVVTTVVPYDQWGTRGSYLYVTLDGLADCQMADRIDVVIRHGDGTQASDVWTDSVRGYAMRIMEAQNDGLKTKLVDLLNRGAAAQIAMGYNVNDLANSQLTEAQQAYATKQ